MARQRRSFGKRSVTKQNFAWLAGSDDFDVRSSAAQTVSNGVALLAALDTGFEPGIRGPVKVKRVLIQGTITRLKTEVITAVRWNVSRQQVDSVQIPIQFHNPADTDPVRRANMQIMRRGQLDIPANIFNALGAPGLSGEAKCFEIDFSPNVTMRRNSEELGMRFATAANDVAVHIDLAFIVLIQF